MRKGVITCPPYTTDIFNVDKFPRIVRWAEEQLRPFLPCAIAACGHSGLLLAGALSQLSKAPVIAVRKAGEQNVATSSVVSAHLPEPAHRWVWIDDCISAGSTLIRCIDQMSAAGVIAQHTPTAILLYNTFVDRTRPNLHDRYKDVVGRASKKGIVLLDCPVIGRRA